MIKPNELRFLEGYEKAKKRIRNREKFINFSNIHKENPATKYLREIGIIREAVREVCYNI